MNLQDARTLAVAELRRHESLNSWTFEFNRSRRSFGYCYLHRHVIQLSAPLTEVNDTHVVWETILHEVGHALVGRVPHDQEWRDTVQSIGGSPTRYWTDRPEANYSGALFTATCPSCGRVYRRYRTFKSALDSTGYSCTNHIHPMTYLTWTSTKPPLNGADVNSIVELALKGLMS